MNIQNMYKSICNPIIKCLSSKPVYVVRNILGAVIGTTIPLPGEYSLNCEAIGDIAIQGNISDCNPDSKLEKLVDIN